ncbi:unnamed protein product [Lepeophtheirus salmonis]|uniref:(salmon louse) hypothetical protein n=1 Tax=Lepeophtheirus salmonis TaxID=72036 RepID=A0A7R8CJE5_LEPSM|nr:unnamed protein product [Lepeophtheirus salmonis]CAF2841247.1 unnamed protein product [Lepeophtheirus salmonis]
MSVRDISEDAFDLILEENSDSELEGEGGCDAKSSYAWKIQGLRGHNVTWDNFFNSYQLGQQLLKRKITKVGTVRKDKPELPPALLASKEREVFSSKFAFTPFPL